MKRNYMGAKIFSKIFFFLLLFSSYALAEDFEFDGEMQFNKPYVFVSLGHNCWQAQASRVRDLLDETYADSVSFLESNPQRDVNVETCGDVIEDSRANFLRDAAFPFDWLTTHDTNKLILCLDEQFKYFNDASCFVRENVIDLENVRYNCRFTHDWPYVGHVLTEERHRGQLAFIKRKYERRIARFESLKNFKGKAFFMRSFMHPSDYQNQSVQRLNEALKRFFPDLNFILVIINWTDNSIFQGGPIEGVREYYRPNLTDFPAYASIFNDLLVVG